MTAPDLYALTDAQLADEMESVTVAHQMRLDGAFTLSTGVRRDPLSGAVHPCVVIKSASSRTMHYIALPGDD